MGLGFISQVVLARLLGVDEFGRYIYVINWVLLLALPARLGFDTAAVRFMASFKSEGRAGELASFQAAAMQGGFGAGAAVGIVAVAVVLVLATDSRGALLVGFIALPVVVLQLVLDGMIRGTKRIVTAQSLEAVRVALLTVIGVALVAVLPGSGSEAAVLAYAIASLLVLGAALAMLWRRGDWQARRPVATAETARWVRQSLPMMLASAGFLALKRIDVLMVGAMRGVAEAGIYAVASRFAELVLIGLTSTNLAAAPRIAEAHSARNKDALQRLLGITALAGTLFTTVAVAALILFAEPLLALFGGAFREGVELIVILGLAQVLNAAAGSVGQVMLMTGHGGEAAWIVGGAAVLNIVLCLLLVPRWGPVGAAWASAITIVAWNLALSVRVKQLIGVGCSIFAVRPSQFRNA